MGLYGPMGSGITNVGPRQWKAELAYSCAFPVGTNADGR